MFTNFASHRPSGIMKSRAARAPKQFKGRTRPNVPLSSKFKTEMCHYLSEQGRCPFGEHCTYAHSKDELRFIERHPKHKTLPCRDFSTEGFCPFGERCSFIHYKSDPEAMWKSLSSSVVTDASEQSAEVDQCSMGQNLRLFHSTDKVNDVGKESDDGFLASSDSFIWICGVPGFVKVPFPDLIFQDEFSVLLVFRLV
ncbi:protein TIS11 isoform X2 [Galendromus occidentalis]|uniref:Protein TIS11 isoform X2 n=1 Tax=Galendromus occidentalis TaxID=34638 RepID=A0AAJ7L7B3_9ACAR|nr:protein TIS11 isoform X2 [Galendromus occidentalis]